MPAVIGDLAAVSDGLARRTRAKEKCFSLGAFDADYVAAQPVGGPEAGRQDRRLRQYPGDRCRTRKARSTSCASRRMRRRARWTSSSCGSWNICATRVSRGSISAWRRSRACPTREAAPVWDRLGRTVFEHGERFYNFKGLRAFKTKFHPHWRPRYLAVSGGGNPVLALMDATFLIGGGIKGDSEEMILNDILATAALRRLLCGRTAAPRRDHASFDTGHDPVAAHPAAAPARSQGAVMLISEKPAGATMRRREADRPAPGRRWSSASTLPAYLASLDEVRLTTTASTWCPTSSAEPAGPARERQQRLSPADRRRYRRGRGALALAIAAQTPAATIGQTLAVDPAAGIPLKQGALHAGVQAGGRRPHGLWPQRRRAAGADVTVLHAGAPARMVAAHADGAEDGP